MQRRDVMTMFGIGAGVTLFAPSTILGAKTPDFGGGSLSGAITRIERGSGGRLGVAVTDLATGSRFTHRGDERFAMCSTFKFPLCAAVLHAVEQRRLTLTRAVPIPRGSIVANSPVVARHRGGTMRVVDLCAATMTRSDNAAANLLLPLIGGTDGFNAFLRRIGDGVTRLDRIEPHLGESAPGDLRDTTTPRAMAATMRAILFGSALSSASQARLTGWLVGNTTGGTRLRAGVPRGWRVGDKTGTGANGTSNDIGVLWPRAGRCPLLVASYLTGATGDDRAQHAVHADVARAIAAALGAG